LLGFGGVGQASARLFRATGAHIYAVTRSGRTGEPGDRAATLAELDEVLAEVDFLVISLPLTRTARRLIGRRELSLMKADAILVNVARAAIVDEDALYEQLLGNPTFSAGIDTWLEERRGTPGGRGEHLGMWSIVPSTLRSANDRCARDRSLERLHMTLLLRRPRTGRVARAPVRRTPRVEAV
jgi:lactate dehydrogenase-like 2-hydroxyacid dehydrogenase